MIRFITCVCDFTIVVVGKNKTKEQSVHLLTRVRVLPKKRLVATKRVSMWRASASRDDVLWTGAASRAEKKRDREPLSRGLNTSGCAKTLRAPRGQTP